MELKTFAKQLGFEQLACWAIRLENSNLLNDRDTAVINLQQFRSKHQQISTQLQKFIE